MLTWLHMQHQAALHELLWWLTTYAVVHHGCVQCQWFIAPILAEEGAIGTSRGACQDIVCQFLHAA